MAFFISFHQRLTGTYAIVVGFTATLFRHMCFGPSCSAIEPSAKGCQDQWWKNMLYINNFGDGNGENFGAVRIHNANNQLFVYNINSIDSVLAKRGICLMICRCFQFPQLFWHFCGVLKNWAYFYLVNNAEALIQFCQNVLIFHYQAD